MSGVRGDIRMAHADGFQLLSEFRRILNRHVDSLSHRREPGSSVGKGASRYLQKPIGMDEFMTLCKLIDVDPYVTVNGGFGDSHSAAEEVEYLNGSVNTRLGALRAKNGHPTAYKVKYFQIGNETWAFLRGIEHDRYIAVLAAYIEAIRAVDPTVRIIVDGLKGESRRKKEGEKKEPEKQNRRAKHNRGFHDAQLKRFCLGVWEGRRPGKKHPAQESRYDPDDEPGEEQVSENHWQIDVEDRVDDLLEHRRPSRIGDLADLILKKVGGSAKLEIDEQRLRPEKSEVQRLLSNNAMARERLGWVPQVSFEDGVERTISWIREHLDMFQIGRYEF